ncbi:hypothetical protein BDN70DRAFT_366948 [Pholiota conissans]|uniref:Uncharacterized protein n=1 Tax=Pholiota conissans TaxID=109636 RepID=A0A9P6D7T3_9AGAR|nr:hypothetical protein BDN70DRAFT_366948 [Pholiota conissans]
MSPKNDDILPDAYKYSWNAQSDLSLQDFLAKYRPSMIQNDGTKPWIWAIEEATNLLKEITEKVENIKNDDSIPIRSNKKTGTKSKKELREQVQADAAEKLKEIAIRNGFVHGKWLIFAPAEKVDAIWSSIASSIVSGPLHSTPAYLTKVSTSSEDENSRGQHLICVYFPDVFDKAKVTEVMKVLLRNHGATLSGVKADLYTHIGIDSKHPSGIPSTIWKNAAIISEKEAKELKDAYFAELAANKQAETSAAETIAEAKSDTTSADKTSKEPLKKAAPKPKLKKKVNSDPFGDSDDDDEPAKAELLKKANTKPQADKKRAQEDADSDEDDEERPKKKRVVKK